MGPDISAGPLARGLDHTLWTHVVQGAVLMQAGPAGVALVLRRPGPSFC